MHSAINSEFSSRNAANALGMEITGTLGILLAYYEEKIISAQKAMIALEKLEEYGYYEQGLIREVKKQMRG